MTDEMNSKLTRDFTKEEVVTTLKRIHPTKSPGSDGVSAIFFQKYWNIVGTNVSNMVLNVLNFGMSLPILIKLTLPSSPRQIIQKEWLISGQLASVT